MHRQRERDRTIAFAQQPSSRVAPTAPALRDESGVRDAMTQIGVTQEFVRRIADAADDRLRNLSGLTRTIFIATKRRFPMAWC